MGTINYGLYTFFSFIICLTAKLRGTAGEVHAHLCVSFPRCLWSCPDGSQEGSRRTKKGVVEEPQPGARIIVMITWDASLENAELLIEHLSKKCVVFSMSNFQDSNDISVILSISDLGLQNL